MPDETEPAPSLPRARRPRSRWRARVVIYLLLIPVVYYGVLFVAQRGIVFPGTTLAARRDTVPRGVERLTLPSDAGEAVAHYRPGDGATAERPGPLLVYAHGNYELLEDFPWMLERYTEQGIGVLAVEYRGYGGVDGKPTQGAITDDFEAFVEHVTQRHEVDGDRLIYHGRSLGGAVAASLAARRPPAAMILESTFTSTAAMGRRFLAPGFLIRDPFRTRDLLRSYDGPVLIVHGLHDAIIPLSHSEQNHAAAARSTLRHYDMTHNDAWPSEFLDDIDAFLAEHGFVEDSGAADDSAEE